MKILVICSGGLDSVSMASRYKEDEVELITFNYGQKGYKEIEIVKELGKIIGAKVKIVDIAFMKNIFGNNQLSGDIEVKNGYTSSVVVTLRNSMFLQVAMIYAYSNNFDKVILGSHTDDIVEKDGEICYPDCSPIFFEAFEKAMDLGTFKKQKRVIIETASTLGLNKADLMKTGYKNLNNFIFKTWSCYLSKNKQCGECESCRNRKQHFKDAGIKDETEYVSNK